MPRARPGQEGSRPRASKVSERNGSHIIKVARDFKGLHQVVAPECCGCHGPSAPKAANRAELE